MSREDIIAIASRLFAISLVIFSLRLGAGVFGAYETFGSLGAFILVQAALAIPSLIAAALLWVFPLSVARKLLPVMKQPPKPISIPGQDVFALALTVLGFWVLATALSDAVYWIVLFFHIYNSIVGAELQPDQTASAVATVVELLMGLWLIFGSQGLTRLINHFRFAGSARS